MNTLREDIPISWDFLRFKVYSNDQSYTKLIQLIGHWLLDKTTGVQILTNLFDQYNSSYSNSYQL